MTAGITDRRRVRPGAVLAALTVLLAALTVPLSGAPAYAHNQLTGSDPADGDRLERAPDEVVLEFLTSLDPEGAELAVTGAGDESVVDGEPSFDGRTVSLPVAAPRAGDYRVDYRVLSTDGHWVEGELSFTVTVGEPTPTPPPPTRPAPETVAPTAAPAATATSDSGGIPVWVWPLLALALAAGGYLTYRLARRGGRAAPG